MDSINAILVALSRDHEGKRYPRLESNPDFQFRANSWLSHNHATIFMMTMIMMILMMLWTIVLLIIQVS